MLIIPCYNERKNIEQLIKRIRAAVPREPVLFIDDNSPDDTASEIRRFQARDTLIFLQTRPGKLGLGSAYREAFTKLARDKTPEYAIAMDADLSHQPETLPQFIEKLKTFDVVVGSRYIAGGSVSNWNWFRRFISHSGNNYARLLTGLPISDLTSGYVGYRVAALADIKLDQIRSEGYAFQIELKAALLRAGKTFFELPIIFSERSHGRSKFSFKIVLEGMLYPLKFWLNRIGL